MHDLQQNKANAIAFYRMAYLGQPRQAVEQYVGAKYIQHNPDVADGPEGFIATLNGCSRSIRKSPSPSCGG